MTVVHDSAPDGVAVAPVPDKPPRYAPGDVVVLKGYEDGWRWTVIDGQVLLRGRNSRFNRGQPYWKYTVETVRPYDGKRVVATWPEWRLRPPAGEG